MTSCARDIRDAEVACCLSTSIMPRRPSEYPSTLLWLLDEVCASHDTADSQTHVTVTAATAIAILWTQHAHCVWFAAGALGSTLVGELTGE